MGVEELMALAALIIGLLASGAYVADSDSMHKLGHAVRKVLPHRHKVVKPPAVIIVPVPTPVPCELPPPENAEPVTQKVSCS